MLSTTAQQKYEEKMADDGMYKMSVWIPHEQRERLSKYAKSLRTKHLSQLKREKIDENSTGSTTQS